MIVKPSKIKERLFMYNFTQFDINRVDSGVVYLLRKLFVEKWHQLAIDIICICKISLHVSIIFVLPLEEPPSSRGLCRKSEKGLINGERSYLRSRERTDANIWDELNRWSTISRLDREASNNSRSEYFWSQINGIVSTLSLQDRLNDSQTEKAESLRAMPLLSREEW